jgi:HEAT repeat protein
MKHRAFVCFGLLTIASFISPPASAKSVDNAAVDKAIAALKTYDYGTDRDTLKPIDEAVIASYGNTSARKELEGKLVAVLGESVSRDANDYCCRILRVVGSADCVPALAALLENKELAHSARYALQSIPDPAAGKALRDALPKLSGSLKIGVIGSLGARRDVEAVAAMDECLNDTDEATAQAAAHALGAIGSIDAAKALTDFAPKSGALVRPAVIDARLECAERLLRDSKKSEAFDIYKSLSGDEQPKHVRLAAKQGMLAARKGE